MPSILMTGFTWVTRKTLQYSWYKGVQRTYRTPFYTLPLIINWICTTLSPTSWKMKMGPSNISFISFGAICYFVQCSLLLHLGLSQHFCGRLQRRLFLEIWCGRDIPHKFWTRKRNSLRFIEQIQKLFWVPCLWYPFQLLRVKWVACGCSGSGVVERPWHRGWGHQRTSLGKIIDQFLKHKP